jgi:hypothetical protein
LFAWGIQISPLSYRFLPQYKALRRLNLALLIVGAVWAFWAPSLQQSAEDMTLSGEYSSANWTSWVAVFVVVIVLIAIAAPKKYSQGTLFRQLVVMLVSFGTGLILCGTYLSFAPIYLTALVCFEFIMFGYTLYSTHYPATANEFTPAYIAYSIFVLLIVPTSVTCLFSSEEQDLVRSTTIAVLGIFCTLNVFLAIMLRFKMSGSPLIRFRTSKKIGAAENTTSDAEYLAVVSNVATLIAYVLAIILIIWLSPFNYPAYFIISSALLMLSKDRFIFQNLTEGHRYTATVVVVQVLMLLFFSADLLSLTTQVLRSPSLRGFLSLFTTMSLFGSSAPGLIVTDIFLYTLKRPSTLAATICALSSLITCIFAPFSSLFYLGVFGVAASLLQLFTPAQCIPASIQQKFL